MSRLIKAVPGPNNSVIYIDENGKKYISSGGTEVYLRFIQKSTGVMDGKLIKNFSSTEFEKLWKAVEKMEGDRSPTFKAYRSGKKEISKVSKNKKGIITHYYVEEFGWLDKAEAIELVSSGESMLSWPLREVATLSFVHAQI